MLGATCAPSSACPQDEIGTAGFRETPLGKFFPSVWCLFSRLCTSRFSKRAGSWTTPRTWTRTSSSAMGCPVEVWACRAWIIYLYIYMYICTYIYVYTYTHIHHIYINTDTCTSTSMCTSRGFFFAVHTRSTCESFSLVNGMWRERQIMPASFIAIMCSCPRVLFRVEGQK